MKHEYYTLPDQIYPHIRKIINFQSQINQYSKSIEKYP